MTSLAATPFWNIVCHVTSGEELHPQIGACIGTITKMLQANHAMLLSGTPHGGKRTGIFLAMLASHNSNSMLLCSDGAAVDAVEKGLRARSHFVRSRLGAESISTMKLWGGLN